MHTRHRQVLRRLHRLLGLSLGVLLVVTSLTGAVLVFYVPLDRLLHPELGALPTAAAEPDWDIALNTLRQAFPDKPGRWRIEVTGDAGPIPARYYNPPERAQAAFAPLMVWLTPDGSAVLRRDYWGDYLVTWLYDLHYRLLLGTTGQILVGIAGLAGTLLLVTGLIAWWPRQGHWRKALRHKPGAAPARALYDQHKLTGLFSLPPLLLLLLTGAALALPQQTDQLLAALSGDAPAQPPVPRDDTAMAPLVPIKTVIAAAHRLWPEARLAWIETPPVTGGQYRLRLQVPGDPSPRFPHSYLILDGDTGTISTVLDARQQNAGSRLRNWLHPLHDGAAGHLPLRILWLVIGLAPLLLFVTGLRRWLLRRQPAIRDSGHKQA